MIYQFIWYFFIYAFLGWCCEVCYAAAKDGVFVNRGFLNGPLCPIYGVGVTLVVWILTPIKENVFIFFVGAVLLTSALEWLTGFILERVFHHKWWDYSDMPFNINGYICLLFSLLWGLACLLIMYVFHPMVASLVNHIPRTLGMVLLCIFIPLVLADISATVATIAKLNRRLKRIDELAAKIHDMSDGLGGNLAELTIVMKEKREDIKTILEEKKAGLEERQQERKLTKETVLKRREAALAELRTAIQTLVSNSRWGERRLLKAFPHLKSTRYRGALKQIKQAIAVQKSKRKSK